MSRTRGKNQRNEKELNHMREPSGPRAASLMEEAQLAAVASLVRLELLGTLEVAAGGGDVADGLAQRGEVEEEWCGVAVLPQRGLPDGASVCESLTGNHGVALVERRRGRIELDRAAHGAGGDGISAGDGRLAGRLRERHHALIVGGGDPTGRGPVASRRQ